VGGIERFVETLAGGLSTRGHDVTVVCCCYGESPLEEEAHGVRVVRVPASYVLDRRLNVPFPLPEPIHLVRLLRRELGAADVVHVQDALYATSAAALLLARRTRVASVITQHVAFVPQRNALLDVVEKGAIVTLGRTARLATRIATYNPSVAAWAEEQWGIEHVRVLPVGVDTHRGRSLDRHDARRSFALPADRFIALFVGRDVPKKGLDIFLDAADPAYELVAVTDRSGDDRGRLLPFMAHDRLLELLGAVDAFVLPSGEGEGFPLSLQEALASGLPAVVVPQAGYERYLADGDVLYVERQADRVRDALEQLARNPELRADLSERARAAAERHFGVDAFVTAYEDLYEEAVRGSRSA
jgi:D-inositol-3-phosphate glycosyltransferase